MFSYFHNHKLKYRKGQVAPFFIVIMVVIMIMALVTINIAKVALTKTESANAADAGALAAGSIMANVFNSIALRNAQLEFQYWTFFTSVSASFTVAVGSLAFALITGGTCLACSALAAADVAWWAVLAISAAVLTFKVAQNLVLQIIRDKIAIKGRLSAIKAGHQFVFYNSGIGSKLKEGDQRDDFKSYMDTNFKADTEYGKSYTYFWQDGQGRAHNVSSEVDVEEVNKFDMQTTLLPSAAVSAFLLDAGFTIAAAYKTGFGLSLACGASYCCCVPSPASAVCCVDLGAAYLTAVPFLIAGIAELAVAWAGVSPTGEIIEDDSLGVLDAVLAMYIYCWIDDIDHDRKVEVKTTQHHEGADLGLWQTTYPDTFSSSRVDFNGNGNGSIHPPKLRHDASIEAVDF